MTLYTIYDHPSDYPDHFVVRRHTIYPWRVSPDNGCQLAPTLEDARALLPAGLYNLGRVAEDDPVIVETWI